MIEVKKYRHEDAADATRIWNRVVEDAKAFPQTECMTPEEGDRFFSEQSYTGIAWDSETGDIVGLYLLHPNNIGRCGHICNSFVFSLRNGGGYVPPEYNAGRTVFCQAFCSLQTADQFFD